MSFQDSDYQTHFGGIFDLILLPVVEPTKRRLDFSTAYLNLVQSYQQPRGGTSRFELCIHHALACTINCVLLAITHAYKCSWWLKPRFSRYFAGGSEGLSRSKGLLFEGKNHGPKDRAELQEYIGEPLARNTVDAFNDGRKY